MPYTIRKQKCKQSTGKSGSYVLSYTDKKGKKHSNCHTSRKKAQGQIAAIEAEATNYPSEENINELRILIRRIILEIKNSSDNKDLNDDGDEDFTDVMIARMVASGLEKEKAIKKAEKATKKHK